MDHHYSVLLVIRVDHLKIMTVLECYGIAKQLVNRFSDQKLIKIQYSSLLQ